MDFRKRASHYLDALLLGLHTLPLAVCSVYNMAQRYALCCKFVLL